MTIGTALVVIAILYLIDRHKLWKRSAIAALGVVVLASVVGATWYGYNNWYAPWRFNRDVEHAQSLKLCAPANSKDAPTSPWVPVLTPDNDARCVDADKVSLEVPPNRIVTSHADVAIWKAKFDPDTQPSREYFIQQIEDCIAKSTPAGNAEAANEQRHWCEQHPDQPVTLQPDQSIPIPKGATVGRPQSPGWCLVVSSTPFECEHLYPSATPHSLPADWDFKHDTMVPCSTYYNDCPANSWVKEHKGKQ